jgi:hypothetical protein
MVLLQISWRRGFKDSRGQGFKYLFSKDIISVFNIPWNHTDSLEDYSLDLPKLAIANRKMIQFSKAKNGNDNSSKI